MKSPNDFAVGLRFIRCSAAVVDNILPLEPHRHGSRWWLITCEIRTNKEEATRGAYGPFAKSQNETLALCSL